MSRIIDYVLWRGDLSFSKDPFNQLDAAIFSQLSILDFDGLIPTGECLPLWQVFNKYVETGHKVNERVGLFITNKQNLLFEAISKAPRYKDLLIGNYVHIYDEKNHCQFEAMTIDLGEKLLISYGGTDDTILGWYEDFELLYLDEIPGHIHGKEYLLEVMDNTEKAILICGHSKGANIAMEVLLNAPIECFNRIEKVYCFDGPGINEKEYTQAVIEGRINKLTSYIPYKASIGKLFNHYEEYKIVECTANIAYQHDLLTWHIEKNDFIYKEHLSNDSIYIDNHLKKMLDEMCNEERKAFVSALFNLLYSTGAKTLMDLYKHGGKLLTNFGKLKKAEKDALNKVFFKKILKDARLRKIFTSFVIEFKNRD